MAATEPIVHVLSIVDGETEETIRVLRFQSFSSDFLRQFDVDPKRDPEMLDRYSVGPDDLPFLEKFLEEQIEFDFARYAYFIEAVRDDGGLN